MNTDGTGRCLPLPSTGEGRGEGWERTDALDMVEIARRITPHPQSLSPLRGEGGQAAGVKRAAILQSRFGKRIVQRTGMKAKATRIRIELGRHIVADPETCGGQPTFTDSRIMVWIILDQIDRGMTWDEIVGQWRGKVCKEAIAEAIAIAPLVEKHRPFKGFHVGARRKPARRPMRIAA